MALGFIKDSRTQILLNLDEKENEHMPADATGNLTPLVPAFTGWDRPAVVDGYLGRARRWQSGFLNGEGYKAEDVVPGTTKLKRSMSIEAVINFDSWYSGGQYRIIQRSDSGGNALWGMYIQISGTPYLGVLWTGYWREVEFTPPTDGKPMYLVVTREWLGTDEVLVKLYANGVMIDSETTTVGTIPDTFDSVVYLGNHGIDPGYPYPVYAGLIIEGVRVSNACRTAEEIRQVYRQLFVYQPWGYELLRACLPPGKAYSQGPDTSIQRELMVQGDGIGLAWSKLTELLEDHLPDRAWSQLERWEAALQVPHVPTDSIAERRQRLVAFLAQVHGYSRDSILKYIAPLTGLDPEDLQLIEIENVIEDVFTSEDPRWAQEVGAGDPAAITFDTAGAIYGDPAVELAVDLGDDLIWTAATFDACRIRTSVPEADQCEITAGIRVATAGGIPSDHGVALYLYDHLSRAFLAFGLWNDGTDYRWFYRHCDGTSGGAVTHTLGVVVTGFASATTKVRYRDLGNGTARLEGFDSALGEWATIATLGGRRVYTGVALLGTSTAAGTGLAYCWSFRMWCPQWVGVFQWFIYRDPSEAPTNYDRASAQLLLNRMRPAHTRGHLIETLTPVLNDPDAHSWVGGEPCL
jgi:uncharacterized protein YmfQ (DUF2313 family)